MMTISIFRPCSGIYPALAQNFRGEMAGYEMLAGWIYRLITNLMGVLLSLRSIRMTDASK